LVVDGGHTLGMPLPEIKVHDPWRADNLKG
jgi:hypothetical protein